MGMASLPNLVCIIGNHRRGRTRYGHVERERVMFATSGVSWHRRGAKPGRRARGCCIHARECRGGQPAWWRQGLGFGQSREGRRCDGGGCDGQMARWRWLRRSGQSGEGEPHGGLATADGRQVEATAVLKEQGRRAARWSVRARQMSWSRQAARAYCAVEVAAVGESA
jgi:hypothetical protein